MHWYTTEGVPRYEVPRSSGKGTRATTLADAKKLKLVPSVTTVLTIAAKPMLERWKTEQAITAALTNPKLDTEDYTSWLRRIFSLSQEKSKVAADVGTYIHNNLESYYLNEPIDEDIRHIIEPTIEIISENFPKLKLNPEVSFASERGFGGKIDISGKNVILDFKTKDKETVDSSLVYEEHIMQLAAYRIGLKMPRARCFNIFISTRNGTGYLHEHTQEELKRGEKMFLHLLEYWKLLNNHESGF